MIAVLASYLVIAGTVMPTVAEPLAVDGYISFDDDHEDALKAIKRGEILSYARIRSIAERELDGKMVGERLRRTNKGWVYEVRVRRDTGKVVFAIINAGSGKVISKR